jgi:hypothetical protein
MSELTQRTSTILISVGGRTRVYRSVREIPPQLREKLIQSTSGLNSATILIADRKGREQILRSLRRRADAPSRLVASLMAGGSARRSRQKFSLSWRHWAEIALIGSLGLAVWLIVNWK